MSGQQRGTVNHDGTTFYFSYSTIIGFRRDGQRAHFTGQRLSVTTARHIRTFGQELGYEYDEMPAEDFARSLAAFPSLPVASFSKFGRVSDDAFLRTGYTDERSILMGRAPHR